MRDVENERKERRGEEDIQKRTRQDERMRKQKVGSTCVLSPGDSSIISIRIAETIPSALPEMMYASSKLEHA